MTAVTTGLMSPSRCDDAFSRDDDAEERPEEDLYAAARLPSRHS